jgi:hypothetical protein
MGHVKSTMVSDIYFLLTTYRHSRRMEEKEKKEVSSWQKSTKVLVGGEWVKAESGETMNIINPS